MLKHAETVTYADLLAALQTMTPEQLAQRVQSIMYECGDGHVHVGNSVFSIGTIDDGEVEFFRSADDNRRHGEQVVLFCDVNPYGEDGVIAWDMNSEDPDEDTPVYPKNHDAEADWTGPAQAIWSERLGLD